MLYRAKSDEDIGVRGCKAVGIGDVFGYELIQNYFVDNNGFGADDEPALTFSKFLTKVKTGLFYGIRDIGQFQVNIGEYKKIVKPRAEIYREQGILSSKLISKSCRVIKYINGNKTIRLYSTDIVQFKGNEIILNSGGYKTTTTKARINQFLPNDIRIYQKNYKWYVDYKRQDLEFKDGMNLHY